MKLTVGTVKPPTSVNLNLSGIVIVIRMKLLNTAGKQITNFNWDQKRVIDRESRLIPRRSKKPYTL